MAAPHQICMAIFLTHSYLLCWMLSFDIYICYISLPIIYAILNLFSSAGLINTECTTEVFCECTLVWVNIGQSATEFSTNAGAFSFLL